MNVFGLDISGLKAWGCSAHRSLLLVLAALTLAGAAQAQQSDTGEEAAADTGRTRQVEIVAPADSLEQVTGASGERERRLIGNVRLRQGTTRLRANRATQYRGRDEILFTGDVLIIDEGDSLWADRVRYDSRRKIGRATGRVRVSDGEVLMAGPVGRYFFRDKRAVFPENVTLVDSARVLKSRSGEYLSDDKRAEFYRRVRVFSDSTYLEADSVTYHRSTEVSEARGHVFIERRGDGASEEAEGEEQSEPTQRDTAVQRDTARQGPLRMQRPSLGGRVLPVDTSRRALLPDTTARTLLWGTRAYNEPRSGYSRVTGRALSVRLQPPDSSSAGAPDTLVVGAHQLETARSDTLRRLTATDSVRLWQSDLQVVADSAVYDQLPPGEGAAAERATAERAQPGRDSLARDSLAATDSLAPPGRPAEEEPGRQRVSRFFGAPVAWSADGAGGSDAQLSGDSLRVTGRGEGVRRLYARGHAFLAQEDSALDGRLLQLKGRRMTGRFVQNDRTGETEMRSLSAGPNAEAIYFQKKDDGTLSGAVRASGDSVVFRLRQSELEKVRWLGETEGVRYAAEHVPDPLELDGLAWVPERRPRKDVFLEEERVRRRLTRPAPPTETPGAPEERLARSPEGAEEEGRGQP